MYKNETKFKRKSVPDKRSRKKGWEDKVKEVRNSFSRAMTNQAFTDQFYKNLFFLKPELEKHFIHTKWEHQRIAIEKGINHLLGFLDNDPQNIHHQNIIRLSETHSKNNLNIHPHHYYYWIDAMVMTLKEMDKDWYKSLEYYTRECLFFPISFMISLYHKY